MIRRPEWVSNKLSSGPGRFSRRVVEIAAWEGLAGLALRALELAGCRILHWYVLPSLRDAPVVESAVPISIADLGATDAAAYRAFRRGATSEQFLSRLENGWRCHAARANGAIVSASWVATGRGRLETLDWDFQLGPEQIYVFDSFTLPEYRGRRIQGAMFAHLRGEYLSQGFEQAVSVIGPENRASLRSRRRCGFKRSGGLARIALGPWQWRFSWGRRELGA